MMQDRIYKIFVPDVLTRLSSDDIIDSIFSYDFVYPISISILLYVHFRDWFTKKGMSAFVELAATVSGSLVAVILTGLAIIVSVSDLEFLSLVENTVEIEHILKPFEYTLLIALISTFSGVLLVPLTYEKWVFFIYFFVFSYLLFSILDVVDSIITFFNKRSEYAQINDMEDIPEQLEEDMKEAVKEARKSNRDEKDDPISEPDES